VCGFLTTLVTLGVWSLTALAGDGTAQGTQGPLTNPLLIQSLQHLSATLERPLFAPNRRKANLPPSLPVSIAAAPTQRPSGPPNVILIGVVSDGQGRFAVVRADGAVKETRVRVGDNIESWRVSQIAERELTLASGDRELSVAMFTGSRLGQILGIGPTQQPGVAGRSQK
jgi:hypothetical protein